MVDYGLACYGRNVFSSKVSSRGVDIEGDDFSCGVGVSDSRCDQTDRTAAPRSRIELTRSRRSKKLT